ncbi:hypothetical protein [Leucobacter chromiireducens]|uniref:hypothetical protein n=1 Tax=Leucobacter chromiireducens TaxID=283877 RepID=UPI003F7D968C
MSSPTIATQTARENIVDLQVALIDLVAYETGASSAEASETIPDASTLEIWLRDRNQHPLDEASVEEWLDRIAEAGLLP